MSLDIRKIIDLTVLEDHPSEDWQPPLGHRTRGLYARVGKELLDAALGMLLIVLTLPIQLVVLGLAAAAYRRWPLLRLARVGRSGRQFLMLRFATEPDKPGARRWPRLSRFLRRWGLDEVPQLWNVLMGQMSLVGPRPRTPRSVAGRNILQQQREAVKPGMTGLAQLESRLRGGNRLSTAHFDIAYIDRLSLRADVRILARTVTSLAGTRTTNSDPDTEEGDTGPVIHARLMFADAAIWLACIALGTWAYNDFYAGAIDVTGLALAGLIAVAIHLVWARRYGIYHGRWRLTSLGGLTSVIAGAGLVTAAISITSVFVNLLPPPAALLTGGAFYIAGAIAARLSAASIHERRHRSPENKTGRLLVFGAGEAGTNAAKAIYADSGSTFIPVAFLDDDRGRRRASVLGLPVVGGRHDIADAARRYEADTILIAMPSAHPREVNQVASIAQAAGLDVQVLPPLAQWLSALLVERARTTALDADSEPKRHRPHGHHIEPRERLRIFDLAVVGLGYVGLPLALEAARVGLRVCGLDINGSRVETLTKGDSYIDDIEPDEVQRAIGAGFMATTDSTILSLADAITISVPTPLKDGLPDLGAVIGAAEAVGDHLLPGQLVVLESTTYPGTTEEVVLPILESRSGLKAGVDFHLAYSPERIDPGNIEYGIGNTPKLMAGIDEVSTERAAALYGKFAPVVEMRGTREAEMAKLLENTYRHVNIALVNELAVFCRELGVDIWEVIRGASTKPFGFQPFYPGPGVGGHCIPIDPSYLSYRVRQLGKQFRFIELAQEINEFMPEYVVERSIEMLKQHEISPDEARVLLLGVAYKPDIGDVRETTATAIVENLRKAGVAVEYCDPHVPAFTVAGEEVTRRDDPRVAAGLADLTLLHTPHRDFDLGDISDSARLLFDLRGAIPDSRHERI